jgi:predicted dehydrogenase
MLFARKHRLVSYSSLDALFQYTDVIDIAADCPNMALAEKALKALKHVHIAHPHHFRLDELQYLTRLADESGVVLHLGAKYNHCPAYDAIAEIKQTPKTVEIKHFPMHTENFNALVHSELFYDLWFAVSLLEASINKISINASSTAANLLQCEFECNNGSSVSLSFQPLMDESQLQFVFNYPDITARVDIFRSAIEKHYNEYDVVDSAVLDTYQERTICRQNMTNFAKAIVSGEGVISLIEQQMQCFAVADTIMEYLHRQQNESFNVHPVLDKVVSR